MPGHVLAAVDVLKVTQQGVARYGAGADWGVRVLDVDAH